VTPAGPGAQTSNTTRAVPGDDGTTFAASGENEIVITRYVNAPNDLVFAAWTDPAYLPHWLGRADWTMTACQSIPRPGGIRRFIWRHDDGTEMGVCGVYREVTAPTGFVCTEKFDGAAGETLNTVRLVDTAPGTTIISTIRYPSTQAREAALATQMRLGFSESLDRLSSHLHHP
jgi:uncharacterized protein YndB with AHSA1/START domain